MILDKNDSQPIQTVLDLTPADGIKLPQHLPKGARLADMFRQIDPAGSTPTPPVEAAPASTKAPAKRAATGTGSSLRIRPTSPQLWSPTRVKIMEQFLRHYGELVTTEQLATAADMQPQSVSVVVSVFRFLGFSIDSSRDLRDRGEDVPRQMAAYRLVGAVPKGLLPESLEKIAVNRDAKFKSIPLPSGDPVASINRNRGEVTDVVDVVGAAAILGAGKSSINSWARFGKLAVAKRGGQGKYMFSRSYLLKLANEKASQPSATWEDIFGKVGKPGKPVRATRHGKRQKSATRKRGGKKSSK